MPEESPANGTNATQATTEPAKGGASPAPIPYAVFKETNDRLKALEGEVAQYGKSKFDEVNGALTKERAAFSTKLALAKNGVQSDTYLEYLADRYHAAPEKERPPIGDWVTKLRSEEPAFFGGVPSATSATATQPSTPSPKTNPDANSKAAPTTTTDPPLTEELIRNMSIKDYARRRAEIHEWHKTRRP